MNNTYFESEEGLAKLLTDKQDIFALIDDISQQLLQGVVTTSEQYREILNQMTGAYGVLEPLYSQAEANKLNKELKSYVEHKRELEGKGEKIVAASLDKEASLSVENERRVRNILEGYVLATEKIIVTCQTQLKRIDDSKYHPAEG